MFANEISVIANVIPRASASWEISLEYDGNPPVAKPTARPLETIVGKLRQGRNTLAARRGRVKSLPTYTLVVLGATVRGDFRWSVPIRSQSRMIFGRKRFNQRWEESCIILHATSPTQGLRRRRLHRRHNVHPPRHPYVPSTHYRRRPSRARVQRGMGHVPSRDRLVRTPPPGGAARSRPRLPVFDSRPARNGRGLALLDGPARQPAFRPGQHDLHPNLVQVRPEAVPSHGHPRRPGRHPGHRQLGLYDLERSE